MTQSYFTSNLFNITDPNITLNDRCEIQTHGKRQVKVLFGTLTDTPSACPECGAKNKGTQDVIRHGYASVTLLLGQYNFQSVRLKLKKQRFLCKHCQHTFAAQTTLVKRHCFISKAIKDMITLELKETQSMTLIAKHLNISVHTVARQLDELSDKLRSKRPTLPTHLSLDEFQFSKKEGAMACVLADNNHHRLMDIIPDRRQSALEAYFLRYSLEERRQVQTVTIDMYAPYYPFIRRLFPQAKIVIDRFHLVQLINRTLQQLRIASMKAIRTSRPRDAHKLKKQWKLLLKHSDDLDFIHYRTHRLYDGLMTEKMMVSYLINLCPRLYQAYDWLNRLKTAIRDHDIEAIRHTVHESHHYTFSWPLRRCFNAFERYMEGIDHACSYTLSNALSKE